VKLRRRTFLHLAASAAALPVLTGIASAQTYPTRPVRIIVPFGAGGGVDITARLVGQWLSERLGQQFVIENRPGAGGDIGTEVVVRAPADGYMLLMVGSNNAINATLSDKLNFNFIRDIAPITSILRGPYVLVVNPSVPVKSVPEFIAYAKAHPGKLNMASPGNGTGSHLAGELFKMMAGVDMVHVPYRGVALALNDVLSGEVQVAFASAPASIAYISAGKMHPVAVTTVTRLDALPHVPTVDEFVRGYEASSWYGVGAPKGTPVEIIEQLNKEISAILVDAKVKARLADLGGTPFPGSPADFGQFIAQETEKWRKMIRAANIKPE
jgi:tripartite-type tricarboxylate transporter receptor subunit TctC